VKKVLLFLFAVVLLGCADSEADYHHKLAKAFPGCDYAAVPQKFAKEEQGTYLIRKPDGSIIITHFCSCLPAEQHDDADLLFLRPVNGIAEAPQGHGGP
jgi:hypothetical protein